MSSRRRASQMRHRELSDGMASTPPADSAHSAGVGRPRLKRSWRQSGPTARGDGATSGSGSGSGSMV